MHIKLIFILIANLFHILVHFSNACNRWGRARAKPEVQNTSQVSRGWQRPKDYHLSPATTHKEKRAGIRSGARTQTQAVDVGCRHPGITQLLVLNCGKYIRDGDQDSDRELGKYLAQCHLGCFSCKQVSKIIEGVSHQCSLVREPPRKI